MPKVKRQYEKQDSDFSDLIKAQIIIQKIETQEKLGKRVGTCKATTTRKINNPASLTVEELRLYVKYLNIQPEDILAFICGNEKSARAKSRNA